MRPSEGGRDWRLARLCGWDLGEGSAVHTCSRSVSPGASCPLSLAICSRWCLFSRSCCVCCQAVNCRRRSSTCAWSAATGRPEARASTISLKLLVNLLAQTYTLCGAPFYTELEAIQYMHLAIGRFIYKLARQNVRCSAVHVVSV